MANFIVTGEQDLSIDKQMTEIKRQIRQKGGSPLNPQRITDTLQDIIEGKFRGSRESEILKLISKNGTFIDACDGTEKFHTATDFYVPENEASRKCATYRSNEKATGKIEVSVYEMCAEVSVQTFFALGVELKKLSLTQHQILNFYRKYGSFNGKGNTITHFLHEAIEKFAVGVHGSHSGNNKPCIHTEKFIGTDWLCSEYHTGILVVPRIPKAY